MRSSESSGNILTKAHDADMTAADLAASPELQRRIAGVKAMRLASPKVPTQKLAEVCELCCVQVKLAVGQLSNMDNAQGILKACDEIDRLESEADHVMRAAMAKLLFVSVLRFGIQLGAHEMRMSPASTLRRASSNQRSS